MTSLKACLISCRLVWHRCCLSAELWSGCQAAAVSPDDVLWWVRKAPTPAASSHRATTGTHPENWGQRAQSGQRSKVSQPSVLSVALATHRALRFVRWVESEPGTRISEVQELQIHRSAESHSENSEMITNVHHHRTVENPPEIIFYILSLYLSLRH